MYKNRSGQGVYVFAVNTTTGGGRTGDAANITATISKDGAAAAALADVNPTEIGGGVYWFTLSQAETNASRLAIIPSSSTGDTVISPVLVETGQDSNLTEVGGVAQANTSVRANIVAVANGQVSNIDSFKADLSSLNDPTASQIAAAVRSEISTELARVDANISSREASGAAASAAASLNDPSAAAVASAVRSELAVELGRIDATVTSREPAGAAASAAASLNDPTASQVASAVRSELGTELGRIDAAVSSRAATGDAMTLTSGERGNVATSVWGKDLSLYSAAGQAGTALKSAESAIGDISGGAQTVKAIVTAVGQTQVTSPNDFKADLSGLDAKITTVDSVVDSIAAAIAALDDPSAAQVASAVRSELATELARLDAAVSSRAAAGSAMSLTSVERNEVAGAILGLADGVEANYSLRQAMRLILSAAAAKVSGMNTNSPVFRDVNDTKNRIVATTDADGNRQTVTLDAS